MDVLCLTFPSPRIRPSAAYCLVPPLSPCLSLHHFSRWTICLAVKWPFLNRAFTYEASVWFENRPSWEKGETGRFGEWAKAEGKCWKDCWGLCLKTSFASSCLTFWTKAILHPHLHPWTVTKLSCVNSASLSPSHTRLFQVIDEKIFHLTNVSVMCLISIRVARFSK